MICAILSLKNMHVIEEIRGKSGLCLMEAPRILSSTTEYILLTRQNMPCHVWGSFIDIRNHAKQPQPVIYESVHLAWG